MPGAARPVIFKNKDALKLFGVFHPPQRRQSFSRRALPGIILLCPGVKNRVAPQRLYVKMAKRFCSLGFPVLRFDFHGIGDSEGEVAEERTADFYGAVQAGRYVGDTLTAMNWMEANCGLRSFILAGLCGGAITGLLAGARDSRVLGLLALGIPVTLDGNRFEGSKYITRGQLGRLRTRYISKLDDPSSWLRLLTFRSDYRTIVKSLCSPLLSALKNRKIPLQKDRENAGPAVARGDLNPLFRGAFETMLESGRRLVFIFSGSDRLHWEFEEKFAPGCDFGRWGGRFQKHIIPHANHVLTFSEWQESMLEIACDWLKPYAAQQEDAP